MDKASFFTSLYNKDIIEIRESEEKYPILIFNTINFAILMQIKKNKKKYKKLYTRLPVFLTNDFLNSSLDSYPADILFIQQTSSHIWGKDCFSKLEIDSRNLRLNVERELRSHLFSLQNTIFTAKIDAMIHFIRDVIFQLRFSFFALNSISDFKIQYNEPVSFFLQIVKKLEYKAFTDLESIFQKKIKSTISKIFTIFYEALTFCIKHADSLNK